MAPDDRPRLLADRYELRDPLGRGGMGVVHRGYDRVLERDVAIKIVAPHHAMDDSAVRRFRREARSAAALNHRNVVAVHDTGADGDEHYIVMELVEGPTLADVIASDAPLSTERTVRIVRGIGDALAAAHRHGIAHRDVKPTNIMFDRQDEPKVADFGLALAATDATRTNTVYGSAPYMAPEQARGDDVDHRADIYALGCVLHEMLTGTPPFVGDQPLAVVSQHLHEEPPPPSAARTELPEAFDRIVGRCLAKEPEDRYPDVESLLADLERASDPATRRIGEASTLAAGAGAAAAGAAGSPWPRRVAAAAVLLVLAGAALLAITGPRGVDGGPVPHPDEEQGDPGEDGAAEGPQLTGVAAVRDSGLDVIELLDHGRERDEVSEDAHEEIRDEVREVVQKAGDDEWGDALDEVDEAREKLDDSIADGQVSVGTGRDLHRALDELEAVVEAERPADSPSPSPTPRGSPR